MNKEISDPTSLEDPDQVVLTSTSEDQDHQQGSSSPHVKSYECTFCKRGFSNAQALGGHMNIHRRDRAKLKLPVDHELSLVVTKNYPSEEGISKPTAEDHGLKGEDHVPPMKLPLFAETPSLKRDRHQVLGSHQDTGFDESNKKSIQGSAKHDQLDLELRLGPEPSDKTSKTGTREFF